MAGENDRAGQDRGRVDNEDLRRRVDEEVLKYTRPPVDNAEGGEKKGGDDGTTSATGKRRS